MSATLIGKLHGTSAGWSAIAARRHRREVLMMAWMNRESLALTLQNRFRTLLVPIAQGAVEEGRIIGSYSNP